MKSAAAYLIVLLLSLPAFAGPRVDIVIGDKAPALERLAADELADQLKRAYEADVKIGSTAPADASHVIFVGSPNTNASMNPFAESWPFDDKPSSDHGHLLRSVMFQNRPALLVGGGSPVATFWAVAEFGHQLGVRSMLFGDVDPVSPPAFRLDGFDVVMKPKIRERGWHFPNKSPTDTGAWGLEEYRRVLRQLAKLKFNRVMVSVGASQPFIHFEYAGVKRETAVLWEGEFPVSGDTSGRKVFGGAKIFENPSFAGAATYEQRIAAGKKHLNGIIDAAHEVGLTITLVVPHSHFPKEFAAVIPNVEARGGRSMKQRVAVGDLTVDASLDSLPQNQVLAGLVKAQFRAFLETYPQADAVELKLLRPNMHITVVPELDAVRQLLSTPGLLRRPDGRDVEVRNMYDRSRSIWSDDWLSGISAIDLHDLQSVLPKPDVADFAFVHREVARGRHIGFYAVCSGISDLDFSAYWLSRAGFERPLKPDQAWREFVEPVCGEGVSDRVIKAFDFIEQARVLLTSPPGGLVNKTWFDRIGAPSDDWNKARDCYLNAMNEMYRANTRAREGGRSLTLYWARRCEFAWEYMNCVDAIRNAGIAKRKEDSATQIAELEKAIESLNNALNAMAAVARSNSDRGLIAVLNEYAYRPLKKKLAEAEAVAK